MSHQQLFAGYGFRLFVLLISSFYLSTTFAATAQSSATVSWATAFAGASEDSDSYFYRAGVNQGNLTQVGPFSDPPSNGTPQGVSYGTVDTGSSAFADSTSLFVESHATDGGATADASFGALFYFAGVGVLTIEIPYTFTSLVQPGAGSSTVSIDARLDSISRVGVTTSGINVRESLDYTGLGSPNELTGVLSLQIPFDATTNDDNTDFAGLLNIFVSSESAAAPIPVKTVPIPGGIALAIPALLPFFANRKKYYPKPLQS